MRWLCTFLIWSQSVHAAVLFQAPGSSGLDYRAALKADADNVSPSAAYIQQHPSSDNRQRLLNLFAEAQKAFLGGTKEEAKRQFENLLSLAGEDDWDRNSREIFLVAYFRLAQIELDIAAQSALLTQALLLGEGLSVPSDLFPPPLIRRYTQLKMEIPRLQISPGFFADGWSVILVNGQPCSKNACENIPQLANDVRVTFLSEQWLPVSVVIQASELNRAAPARVPWITGSCEKTNFHPQTDSTSEKKAFWFLNCGAQSKPKAINFLPVSHADPVIAKIEMDLKPRPFYKSPWFWGGVGAVVIAAIALSAKKQEKEREPTTTYGY